MQSALDLYIRQRCRERGMSLAALCRQAGISRQTLYDLALNHGKLPSLQTVVAVAGQLGVHPMRLLQLIFDAMPVDRESAGPLAGDRSAFVRDVNFPDGELVLPGQRFVKTWELQNVGVVPWVGRRLVCQDESLTVLFASGEQVELAPNLVPDAPACDVPETGPGDTVQLSMGFTAPSAPATVLSYWKMVNPDGGFSFPGARGVWVKIRVTSLASSAGYATTRSGGPTLR
ncbi:MAG: helix-turn-helix domain-containing protein [Proteobacteria bacterium]|nr:MAG: helix-turn-helix domain-containing protein [Pseudomonadota bacterium]